MVVVVSSWCLWCHNPNLRRDRRTSKLHFHARNVGQFQAWTCTWTAPARGCGPAWRHQLREAVRSGRLAPGLRLPSSRSLAADLGVARNTVVNVYGQLVAEGWLVARQGSVTRVAGGAPAVAEAARAGRPPTFRATTCARDRRTWPPFPGRPGSRRRAGR